MICGQDEELDAWLESIGGGQEGQAPAPEAGLSHADFSNCVWARSRFSAPKLQWMAFFEACSALM